MFHGFTPTILDVFGQALGRGPTLWVEGKARNLQRSWQRCAVLVRDSMHHQVDCFTTDKVVSFCTVMHVILYGLVERVNPVVPEVVIENRLSPDIFCLRTLSVNIICLHKKAARMP